jgi:membrane-anchored mycosin MYCP
VRAAVPAVALVAVAAVGGLPAAGCRGAPGPAASPEAAAHLATIGTRALAAAQPAGGVEPRPREAACTYNDIRDVKPFPRSALPDLPWPQHRLGYQQAQRYSTGQGVTVAVVDSGVQGDAPQLAGHVLPGFDLTSGSVRPGGDTDCFTHGTAVAGIIAANPRQGIGFVGVAPGVRLLPIRETWGIDDNGQPTTAAPGKLVDAINLAVRSGATVINVSVTVDGDLIPAALRQAFRAAARDAAARGAVIVAASGNASEQQDRLPQHNSYPAALAAEFDNVLAVGGIEPDGTLYRESVYGTSPYITVVAPANGVVSTFIDKGRIGSLLQYRYGTSFATPFVTGTVALLQARFPGMAPGQIKRRIEQTADHPSTNLPDLRSGWGVVNPVAALTAVVPPAPTARPAPRVAAPLPPPPAPDVRTRDAALAAAATATLLALALAAAALVLPRGRRRHWRPGAP